MNSIPYEVLVGSGTVYVAPSGTLLSTVVPGAVPSSPWVKIGTSGDLNYDEDTGIEFVVTETVVPWIPLGGTAPRKQFRTEESVSLKLDLADMTLEQIKYVLNGNTITDVPSTVSTIGYRKIGMAKGQTITGYAMICRYTASPYGDNVTTPWIMEYRHTIVQVKSEPKFTAKKGEPMLATMEFMAQWDSAAAAGEELGVWIAQDANAS